MAKQQQVWEQYNPGLSPLAGARSHIVAVPSDTLDITDPDTGLTKVSRSILCLSAGNITVLLAEDIDDGAHTITIPFATGEIKPLQCRRIYNTGTTSTSIVCLM